MTDLLPALVPIAIAASAAWLGYRAGYSSGRLDGEFIGTMGRSESLRKIPPPPRRSHG